MTAILSYTQNNLYSLLYINPIDLSSITGYILLIHLSHSFHPPPFLHLTYSLPLFKYQPLFKSHSHLKKAIIEEFSHYPQLTLVTLFSYSKNFLKKTCDSYSLNLPNPLDKTLCTLFGHHYLHILHTQPNLHIHPIKESLWFCKLFFWPIFQLSATPKVIHLAIKQSCPHMAGSHGPILLQQVNLLVLKLEYKKKKGRKRIASHYCRLQVRKLSQIDRAKTVTYNNNPNTRKFTYECRLVQDKLVNFPHSEPIKCVVSKHMNNIKAYSIRFSLSWFAVIVHDLIAVYFSSFYVFTNVFDFFTKTAQISHFGSSYSILARQNPTLLL
ncbi:hypothetical protein VP01_1177g3 [Puccinia sorghi]|uniref:Uncharacterized protein n=1 Tax=Puccinia sorghi TaxID=27349 RepID=A0A0L6VR59_9BASI|nr:hypothetical protein VP01_1177g3 [Puccinia sorghi]